MTAEEIKQFQRLLREELKGFVTKGDLKVFATKDDLKSFATKGDLKDFATRDEIRGDIREELKRFVTKDDLIRALLESEKRITTQVGEFMLDQVNPQIDQKLDKTEFDKFKKQLRSLS